ncbi:uncharacterized protein LOC117323318 [Pecten maximus]|uniref:uncharacterized protein LOC117323318 n=1 Tax=Pecten maximus TaxID=6579 RepID=UPI001458923C|nr:uncharacterized protein LOC117323318 [Pecten maximus]
MHLEDEDENNPSVPKEFHPCKKITVEVINKVLNVSEYIGDCDGHRNLVVGVRCYVSMEKKWVLKNCKLTIALDNPNGDLNNRVKCIVIPAGKCENEIYCSRKPNGSMSVVYIKTCMRLKVLNGIRLGVNIFKDALIAVFQRVAHDTMLSFRDHPRIEVRDHQNNPTEDIEVVL